MTVQRSVKPGDLMHVVAHSLVYLVDRPRGTFSTCCVRPNTTVLVVAIITLKSQLPRGSVEWCMIVGNDGAHGWTCWGLEHA